MVDQDAEEQVEEEEEHEDVRGRFLGGEETLWGEMGATGGLGWGVEVQVGSKSGGELGEVLFSDGTREEEERRQGLGLGEGMDLNSAGAGEGASERGVGGDDDDDDDGEQVR